MRKTLYQYKRNLIKAWETARLKKLMGKNSIFLKQLLASSRATLDELYQTNSDSLVSDTIPTYNIGQLLTERAIPSVLNQTYTNWELIIYGDVCTDDTAERMKSFTDPRIRFYNLNERLKGTGDPFYDHNWYHGWKPNICAINEASGLWLALFNDDDEFTPNHIEALLRHAQKTNAELVYGKQVNALADGKRIEIGRPGFPTGKPPYFKKCIPQRTVLMRSYLRPLLFSRIDYRTHLRFSCDMFWWEQMGAAGVRAEYLDKVVAVKYFGVKRASALPS